MFGSFAMAPRSLAICPRVGHIFKPQFKAAEVFRSLAASLPLVLVSRLAHDACVLKYLSIKMTS
ncbi:MAG: hypothetical protein DCF30_14185 [Hyphomicrobiales bacterium]|nr:MAG: hypothetical protein DCF30_14185 [Hyphomicrobiales bacterium]